MNKKLAKHNLESLTLVAHRLDELCQEVTFVGGCIIGLLITDMAAPDVRFTVDVDCIVDVITQPGYHALSKKLRQKGFKEIPYDNHPICRWDCDGILVDIVPTGENVLGFTNKWYQEALYHVINARLTESETVKIISAPYFIATKLEAFKDRGNNDFLSSHDIEDIISVIDGRPEIIQDFSRSSLKLREHLSSRFLALLNDEQFLEALPGHLNYTNEYENRKKIVLDRMRLMINSWEA